VDNVNESTSQGKGGARLLAEALEYFQKREMEDALRCALQGLKSAPPPLESAQLNRIAAEVYLGRGRLNEAFDYVTTSRRDALSGGDSNVLCMSALTLGRVYARMNRYALADKAWSEALSLANIIGDIKLQGRILINKAILCHRQGDLNRVLGILEEAKERFGKIGDLRGLAAYYSRKAFYHSEKDEPELAMQNLLELEKLAAQLEDSRLDAETRFRRGALHLNQKEYTLARQPLEESCELFKNLGDRKNRAIVLHNLIRVHLAVGQIAKAGMLLMKAIDLANEIDLNSITSTVHELRGRIAVYRGEGDKAVRHFTDALSFAGDAEDVECFRILQQGLRELVEKLGLATPDLEKLLRGIRADYSRMGLAEELAELDVWLEQLSH